MNPAGTVQHRRAAALALTAAGFALIGGGGNSGTLTAATGAATLIDANGGVFTSGVSNLLPAALLPLGAGWPGCSPRTAARS